MKRPGLATPAVLVLACLAGQCVQRPPLALELGGDSVIVSTVGLEKCAGQRVVLEGQAQNRRGRPALQLQDGLVFLVTPGSSWPADALGRRVGATGNLRAVDVYPAFDVDDQGRAVGPPHTGWIFTLEQPLWRIVSPPGPQ